MNFAERFKGKTSIMTKEGMSALVQSSQVPIFKTTGMQGMAPPDPNRQASSLASITASQSNMHRPLQPQPNKGLPKYPSTWPPVASDKSHVPKLSNLQVLRPVKTQNNTPLTDRGAQPSWNRQSALTEADSPERATNHLSGFGKNAKQGYNEPMSGIQKAGVMVLRRSQSTVKERVPSYNDLPNSNIHPLYADVAKKLGQTILVQRKPYSRELPLRSNEVVNTESPERRSQIANRDDSPNLLRRATSQRELVDREVYSRQHFYRNQPQKMPEDSLFAHIENNVAKYSLHGSASHSKIMPLKIGSCQSLENESEQKSGIISMTERKRDIMPGPSERPNSNRNPEISRQILQNINQRIGKAETRVTFRGEDIIDRLKLQSEDRIRRSNSNDSLIRAQAEQRETRPLLRFTGRRMENVDTSKP